MSRITRTVTRRRRRRHDTRRRIGRIHSRSSRRCRLPNVRNHHRADHHTRSRPVQHTAALQLPHTQRRRLQLLPLSFRAPPSAQAGDPRHSHSSELPRKRRRWLGASSKFRLAGECSYPTGGARQGAIPAARIAAHLLSRPSRSHVKHLVPLQLQWGRKLAAIPTALRPPPASGRENATAPSRKIRF